MPNYNIYIPNAYEEKLRELCKEQESIGQAAKRLLIGLLGGDQASIPEDQLQALKEELGDRIDKLETAFQAQSQKIEQLETLIEQKKEAVNDSVQNHSQPIGLTNPQLAERLNLNRSSVSRWTKKGCDPSGEWIWRDGLWFQK